MHELQQHVQSTRERTLKLLAEKDLEIQQLRSELYSLQGVQDSPLMSVRKNFDRSVSTSSVSSTTHEGDNGSFSVPVEPVAAIGKVDSTSGVLCTLEIHIVNPFCDPVRFSWRA